jgi:SAM-dependent methyltransferase
VKRSILPLLACPVEDCAGALAETDLDALPKRAADGDPDELLEGGLRCLKCGAEHPVLSGVAVLHPEPEGYLRRYHRAVARDLERHGSLSAEARLWLARFSGKADQEEYGADFRFSQQFEDPWDVARAMTEDPAALYGPFADWLRCVSGQSPYDVLAAWARELPGPRHLALDAGCGGGGLVARLAPAFQAVFGVDLSFLAVLLARRVVLHRPEPERSYFLSVRRGQEVERPLPARRVDNAEFVVGDCCALPFAPGLFDAVCSSNVIDIAGVDRPLDEAARVLRSEGLLLLSDPFFFREGEAPPGDPKDAVRQALRSRGLRVEAERDAVPWAWVTYDRHWRLYFNYCAAARKS